MLIGICSIYIYFVDYNLLIQPSFKWKYVQVISGNIGFFGLKLAGFSNTHFIILGFFMIV
ncbi:hypothetical protein BD770DRAFT_384379 [Pilaira anomala]|nr:hypothetical protein BD770DRAFT_384379 [Pilaira anomala]